MILHIIKILILSFKTFTLFLKIYLIIKSYLLFRNNFNSSDLHEVSSDVLLSPPCSPGVKGLSSPGRCLPILLCVCLHTREMEGGREEGRTFSEQNLREVTTDTCQDAWLLLS